MSDDDAKKWRRDVGLDSVYSGARPSIPRLLALAPLAAALTALAVCLPTTLRPLALRSCGIGLGAYLTTIHLVPVIARKIPRAKHGCDLLKRPPRQQIVAGDKTVPESLGLVSGVVFVLALVISDAIEPDHVVDAHTLAAATLAIALAILLGFADDVLDLEWRYKYALPPLMALPLLAAYDGGTVIRPPRFLRSWLTDSWLGGAADAILQLFGGSIVPEAMGLVDLGRAYQIYMVLLVVFCTNLWGNQSSSALQSGVSRGRSAVLSSGYGRGYPSEIVSRFEPKTSDWLISTRRHERREHLRRRQRFGMWSSLCDSLFHPSDGRGRITQWPIGELHSQYCFPTAFHRHNTSSAAEQLVSCTSFCR